MELVEYDSSEWDFSKPEALLLLVTGIAVPVYLHIRIDGDFGDGWLHAVLTVLLWTIGDLIIVGVLACLLDGIHRLLHTERQPFRGKPLPRRLP